MLSAADLAGIDTDTLPARLACAARRQDFYRREAESFDLSGGFYETHQRVMNADADAAVLAEAERLASAVRRALAAERRERPAATVTHLRVVPKPEPRPGTFARVMAMLGRQPGPASSARSEDAA